MNAVYAEMEARGREVLQGANVPVSEQQFVRTADMRYVGQMYEITVPVPAGALTEASRMQMEEYFHNSYLEIYGTHTSDAPIEALNWRLLATSARPEIPLQSVDSEGAGTLDEAFKGTRQAFFGDHGGWSEATVYDRYSLPQGVPGSGPAIVEERESTVIVPPESEFVIDEYLNLRVTIRG